MDADLAAEALQGIEESRERARLAAGLTPAWYGPAAAVALIVPAVVDAWARGRGGWAVFVSLLVALAGLAVVVALVNVARRRSGVMVTLPRSARLRRAAVPLLIVLAAGAVTYGLCRQLGAGQAVGKIALFAVLGAGAWAVFAIRNATISRKLRAAG
jgi:hypothetical protein